LFWRNRSVAPAEGIGFDSIDISLDSTDLCHGHSHIMQIPT